MAEKFTYNNFLLDVLISKKWSIIRHVGMILFLALFFYPQIDLAPLKKIGIKDIGAAVYAIRVGSLMMYLFAMSLIYFNLLILTPVFLIKNKFGLYTIACFILAFVYYIIEYFFTTIFLKDFKEFIPTSEFSFKGFVDSAFIPLVFLAASAGYKVFKKWIKDTALLAELKQVKVQEELNHLKNQINPHFLFNTLNNLNTLITVNPQKASSVVLGLSDVLRYQLYEATDDKVLLKKDIEILQQYLELEKIRRDNFKFSINIEGNINGILIPPFIFINFVENAIKHSVDNQGFSYIAIHFIETNGMISFNCKNSKPAIIKAKINGGLGLKNISRRLELIYGELVKLEVIDNTKEFYVDLKLPIKI
jgi:sensor histidine kinase YesM